MGAFDKLLQNKGIKNFFLNQFKDIIKDQNLKSIIISVDENGEYKVDTFTEKMAVISQEKLNVLISVIKNYKPENLDNNEQSNNPTS